MNLKSIRLKLIVILIGIFSFLLAFGLPSLIISDNLSTSIDTPKLSTQPIQINTPENIGYCSPMSGYFPGTYDFFECNTDSHVYYGTYDFRDEINEIGYDIDFIDYYLAGSNSHAKIVSSWQDHTEVLELKDYDETDRVLIQNDFSGSKADAQVEFWWGTSSSMSTKAQLRIKLKEGSNTNVELRFWQTYGKLEYNDGDWKTLKSGLVKNTWYHIKIECDDSLNRYYVYVDGIKYGPFNYKIGSSTGPDQLSFATLGDTGYSGYYHYIDAVGYSWDTTSHGDLGYSIGYNVNPYDLEPLLEEGFDVDLPYNTHVRVANEIADENDSHKKVLELVDNTDSGYYIVENSFTGQGYGTIEYWIMVSDVSKYVLNNIQRSRSTTIHLSIDNGHWYCYNGFLNSVVPNVPNPENNKWHHVTIHFRCYGAPAYNGLAERSWRVIIDGTNSGTLWFYQYRTHTYISRLTFSSYKNDKNYRAYIDAIGYSWDPDYEIGNNQDEKMGNYYPATHNFVDCDPTSKIYYGTYDFRDEENNEIGYDIDFIDVYSAGSNCHAKVFYSWQDHEKVLQLRDYGYSTRVYIYNYFEGSKADAQVEFWWGTSSSMSTKAQLRIKLKEGSNTNVELRFWQTYGKLEYNDGDWKTLKSGLVKNTWYHIKIECDDSLNRYYVYVDGIKYGPFNYRIGSSKGPDRLYFATMMDPGYSGYYHYIDAVGYSWDEDSHNGIGYNVGYNLYSYYDTLLYKEFAFDLPYNTYLTVADEIGSHKKVLELIDNSDLQYYFVENSFSGQNKGTIEYWIRISDASKYILNNIRTGVHTTIHLSIDNGKWCCYDGYTNSPIPKMPDPVNNKWHHITVHFECTTGGYMGLGRYKWKVIIDGFESQSLTFYKERTPSYIDKTTFSGSGSQKNYNVYIDSIGYSWDSSYEIGYNYYEGIFLKFEPDNLLNMRYIIDSEDPVYISGDTVIPMPDLGSHSIQVLGEDSYGTDFESDIINFYVNSDTLDWGVDIINAEWVWGGFEDALDIWTCRPTGKGINVLVIDSGIDYYHDDLNDNYQIGGEDYIDSDNDPFDSEDHDPWNGCGHGTHCAGIIAAEDNGIGIIGVAPQVNVYVARAAYLDGYMSISGVSDAIDWATHTIYDSDPNNDIDIISMSFELGDDFPSVRSECEDAYYAGIILVACSGNDDPSVMWPAKYDDWVIAVGAVDQNLQRASFSNYGSQLDIMAPGVDINSPCTSSYDGSEDDEDGIPNDYAIMTGTSMACPMVAGVCALILSVKPDLTLSQIEACLYNTALDRGESGWDQYYGWGVVDALAAVNYAIENF